MMLGCAIIASAGASVSGPVDVDVTTFTASSGDGAVSFDAGAKTLSVAYGTTTTSIRGTHTVEVAKRYRISWTYSGSTLAQMLLGTSAGGTQYRLAISGDVFVDFTATTTTAHITFQRNTSGTTTVSGITIQEIPEVTWVDNAQVTPAGWVALSAGVTVDGTTGTITIPAAGSTLLARQSLLTVANTLYRLRWVNNNNTTQCLIGSSQGGAQMKSATSSDSLGAKTYEFRATGTTTWIQFQRSTAGTANVSDIFMQDVS